MDEIVSSMEGSKYLGLEKKYKNLRIRLIVSIPAAILAWSLVAALVVR
jgi:hypothetical protein